MSVSPRVASDGVEQRANSSRRWFNRIDPVYTLLDKVLFSPFFTPRLPGPDAPPAPIESSEVGFLLDNLRKHRAIVWMNLIAVVAIIASGLARLEHGDLVPLLPGFAAPVIVSGIAWYSISFSGVPERFGRHAMLVTGVLFFAVSVSSTALFVLLATVTPVPVAALVLVPIYGALYLAAVYYDNLDGLRATASQKGPVFSRAQTYGDHPPATPPQQPTVPQTNFATDLATESFDELAASIDRQLEELAAGKPPRIANFLVGDCLKQVARLLNFTPFPLELDADFDAFVVQAHELSVDEVNERASHYLRVVLERLQSLFGDSVADDGIAISERLAKIEWIRSAESTEEGHAASKQSQELADFLFVEVFRQLVSVVRANKSRLFAASGGMLDQTTIPES